MKIHELQSILSNLEPDQQVRFAHYNLGKIEIIPVESVIVEDNYYISNIKLEDAIKIQEGDKK